MSSMSIRETVANLIYPEQQAERRNLTRLVNLDALTGLGNRRAFELALPAAEADPGTVVVLFDANNFGRLNKTAGHRFGDVILKEMADVITRGARAFGCGSRAFRPGGDEFAVLVPTAFAVQVRDGIERAFGDRYGVSLSGTIGQTFEQADALLQDRKADRKKGAE